jgi:hypothetical protein
MPTSSCPADLCPPTRCPHPTRVVLQSYVPIPVPHYLSSEWSFAQYRVPAVPHQHPRQQQHGGAPTAPPPSSGGGGAGQQGGQQGQQGQQQQHGGPGRIIVGFSPAELHTLVIVTQAGGYYKVGFDPAKGGACAELAACNFAAWLQGEGDGGELGGEAVLV